MKNVYFSSKVRSRPVESAGWAHICPRHAIPPACPGSYTHLLSQLLESRKDSDIVIARYDSGSLQMAEESDLPVVQIPFKKARFSRIQSRLHAISGRTQYDPWLFQSIDVVRRLGYKKILVWGAISTLPILRHYLPDTEIVFAQRHYDYAVSKSYYNFSNYVIMQTPGQVIHAFNRVQSLTAPIVIIPNGVETDLFEPANPDTKRTIRAELGIGEEKFVAIFPSKLTPKKGSTYLPIWIDRLLREPENIHFVILGRFSEADINWKSEQLRQILSSAPNLTWLESVSRHEMPRLFQGADVCVMPGLWREGFSMSAIEAMATALPVVATNAGCYLEIIRHGYNGLLCPQELLVQAVCDSLRTLSQDRVLCRRMGQNARGYVAGKLTRQKVLKNFRAFLEGRLTDIDSDLCLPETD